jgi:hypothetical protein
MQEWQDNLTQGRVQWPDFANVTDLDLPKSMKLDGQIGG